MKPASLILLVGIYFQLSCSDHKPNVRPLNDLDRMKLNGDVKSLTVAINKAVEKPEGIIKEEFVSKFIYLFNEHGYMTESERFKSDSVQGAKTTYKYDEKGNIVEEIINYGLRILKVTYKYGKYDDFGNWLNQTREESSVKTGKVYSVIITERIIEFYK